MRTTASLGPSATVGVPANVATGTSAISSESPCTSRSRPAPDHRAPLGQPRRTVDGPWGPLRGDQQGRAGDVGLDEFEVVLVEVRVQRRVRDRGVSVVREIPEPCWAVPVLGEARLRGGPAAPRFGAVPATGFQIGNDQSGS